MSNVGINGALYELDDKPFAGGGEGDIYVITNAVHLVAKKYKPEKATTAREQKIIAMLSNPPSDRDISQFAWPIDLLYENNMFAGYVMPRLQNTRALNEVYDYDNRKDKPWNFYISVAKNLTDAIHDLHKIGYICGDLNPDNISVDEQGDITLLDTDSYHVYDKINNRIFRCEVGRPEYMPSELQGLHLGSAPLPTFTRETDNFALAILIFILLMNSCHPFACVSMHGSVDKPKPVENITKGVFPFMQANKGLTITIPSFAPSLDMLTSELQDLFKKAFIDGHANPQARPQASDWYYALNNLNRSLKRCAKDNTHFYYSGLNNCPWCGMDVQMSNFSQDFSSGDYSVKNSGPGQYRGPALPAALYDYSFDNSFDIKDAETGEDFHTMIYAGIKGTEYNLAQQPFAGGGDSDIYEITNAVQLVAKKYKPKRISPEREQKIIAMLNNPPPVQDISQFTWPVDILYENNQFTGYIMPRLQNTRALNEVYDYDDRKGKPWDFYVSTAKNLAAVIHVAHKIGHVCGDLNPDNISVNPQSVITLIDTDSYHIYDKTNNREFRCGVGRPEFLAPELQGFDLGNAPLPTFTRETDNFALAVLIFSLLMNGSHPYSCSSTTGSLSKFQPIDNIARGLFPFVQTHAGLSIPNSAPPIDMLTSELQDLFKKAFIDGHANPQARPQASDWYYALNNLNSSLKKCAKDSTHFYYEGIDSCPWCEIEKKMIKLIKPKKPTV